MHVTKHLWTYSARQHFSVENVYIVSECNKVLCKRWNVWTVINKVYRNMLPSSFILLWNKHRSLSHFGAAGFLTAVTIWEWFYPMYSHQLLYHTAYAWNWTILHFCNLTQSPGKQFERSRSVDRLLWYKRWGSRDCLGPRGLKMLRHWRFPENFYRVFYFSPGPIIILDAYWL